jgi:hypothetical protein
MGHYDPLDGFITYNQLQAIVAKDPERASWPDLNAEIADIGGICEGKRWGTDDPLGIGGLLCDAYRVAQLIVSKNFEKPELLEILLEDSLIAQDAYARTNTLKLPADYRLAFRELGLLIGFRAVEKLQRLIEENPAIFNQQHIHHSQLEALMRYAPWAKTIETFWLEPRNRKTNTWTEHCDINMVMLATSLAPDGYLAV